MYTYDQAVPPTLFLSIRTEDPGDYPVSELLPSGKRFDGTSNSLRQFTLIREGIRALLARGAKDDDLIIMMRSDLSLISEPSFDQFLTDGFRRLRRNQVKEVRLTTNSINPFSFTGHGIHGSDWVIVCNLGRLVQKMAIDPTAYAIGHYSPWQRMRKGIFCYGALSAEEIFSAAHYMGDGREHGGGKMLNSVNLSFGTKIRFLKEIYFVLPNKAGITLAKWQYLHCLENTSGHPFGPGLKGRLKSLFVWASFSSELVPPSSRGFWVKLVLKAVASWMIQIPRNTLLAFRRRG
jgi:hypothetical protein